MLFGTSLRRVIPGFHACSRQIHAANRDAYQGVLGSRRYAIRSDVKRWENLRLISSDGKRWITEEIHSIDRLTTDEPNGRADHNGRLANAGAVHKSSKKSSAKEKSEGEQHPRNTR
jgi:hypothetical protein